MGKKEQTKMTSAFEDIKAGLMEAIAHADGKAPHIKVHRPRPVDVKAIKAKIGMTQEQLIGIKPKKPAKLILP
jgi:putative transcriptional regulator